MNLLEIGILVKYTCFFCYTAPNCVILQHQILKRHSMRLKRRILHNLSKVTRTVNAQGRIESYSNVLVVLHGARDIQAQYSAKEKVIKNARK